MEFCQFIWDDNPPGSIQSHPNNLQTPSKHPQAPSRQPQIIPHICHFSPHTQFLAQFFFMQMRKNWPLIAALKGVCRVSGRCLGGVLEWVV